MKLLVVLLLLFGTDVVPEPSRLELLSKTDAENAAAYIRRQQKVFFYCDCCEETKPVKIRPERVKVQRADDSDLYNVIVFWTPVRQGIPISRPVDLANVWVKKKFKYMTVATALNLKYNSCRSYPKER